MGISRRSLRTRIQLEEGHVPAKPERGIPFGSRESKGYKWNMYSWLLIVTFGHPFALLTIHAAKAQDSIVLFAILAVLAATFMISGRVFIHRPEQTLNLWRAAMIVQFPLLLAVLQWRWNIWTGQTPWQLRSDVSIFLVVGFLLFAFALLLPLVKRNV
jgi:hypothetical protein